MPGNIRRQFLLGAAYLALAGPAFGAVTKSLKLGSIGAGRIGGTLGKLWADAGYAVMLSGLELGPVQELAAKIGPNVSAGTPADAVKFADIVVMSVPYEAVAQVARDYGPLMKGKIVIDTCNPKRETYAEMTATELKLGTGVLDQRLLPGTRLVKAFNCVNFGALKTEAHRAGEPAGVLMSSDDKAAMNAVGQLVRDAGYEPIVVGDLSTAAIYDSYTPFHANGLSVGQIRQLLKEKPAPVFTDAPPGYVRKP